MHLGLQESAHASSGLGRHLHKHTQRDRRHWHERPRRWIAQRPERREKQQWREGSPVIADLSPIVRRTRRYPVPAAPI